MNLVILNYDHLVEAAWCILRSVSVLRLYRVTQVIHLLYPVIGGSIQEYSVNERVVSRYVYVSTGLQE